MLPLANDVEALPQMKLSFGQMKLPLANMFIILQITLICNKVNNDNIPQSQGRLFAL